MKLDEPTGGLDSVSRGELLHVLSEYIEDGEHGVLFSTHIAGDLERVADYITDSGTEIVHLKSTVKWVHHHNY